MHNQEIDLCTIIDRREINFKLKYPDIYEEIMSLYDQSMSWYEKLYRYRYSDEIENIGLCAGINCSNPTSFISYKKGFRLFCCAHCVQTSPEIIKKREENSLKKYGCKSPNQVDSVKNKQKQSLFDHYGVYSPMQSKILSEKAKQTCINNYGVSNPSLSKELQEKKKETCIKNFGCEYPMQSKEVKSKSEKTCLIKYGKKNSAQSKQVKNKMKETCLKRYGVENFSKSQQFHSKYIENYINTNEDVIDIYNTDTDRIYICKCPHPNCNKCQEKQYTITSYIYANRKNNGVEPCTNLLPVIKDRNTGTTIEQFVRSILDENNINYINNDRTILNGKELDIYIPDKNLAIECNGIYWHSSINKNKTYHFDKWNECRKKQITLLTIWEDQIIHKPNIIKSIILSHLNIYNKRLYARNCKIKEISSDVCNNFLNEHHLQGSTNSRIRLGLYFGDDLVSIMSFGLKRKCMGGQNGQWELHRYCCKKEIQVIGGASKLFAYFTKKYNPDKIESFSSNDISNGGLYDLLGFINTGSQSGSYWYIEPKTYNRYHRYNFRKDMLLKNGFDPLKTEFQIMSERGYFRIYDSGQSKWVKTSRSI